MEPQQNKIGRPRSNLNKTIELLAEKVGGRLQRGDSRGVHTNKTLREGFLLVEILTRGLGR